MRKEIETAEQYADIIMRDERDKIVDEKPIVYESGRIERLYEFADGAVVKYEWRSTPDGRTSPTEEYNHRFTLVALPAPNPRGFKKSVIKQLNYPR
jgi:hypothetical protein